MRRSPSRSGIDSQAGSREKVSRSGFDSHNQWINWGASLDGHIRRFGNG